MKKNYSLKIFLVFIFILSALFFLFQRDFYKKSSLDEILDYYGFYDKNQKTAMHELCKFASIIPSNKTAEDIFPSHKTENQVVANITTFVEKTQEKFYMRTDKQERWDVEPNTWMLSKEKIIQKDLKVLGFIDDIIPTLKKPDAICILGATKKSMECRISYAEFLLKKELIKTNVVIFLVGERYATVNIDGPIDELISIAENFKIVDWKKLTETHLAKHLYDMSYLHNKTMTSFFIDTPAENGRRPTTQTTLLEFIKWLKAHKEIKTIVFISNQPYVRYQRSIILSIFKNNSVDIHFEVIGKSAGQSTGVQKLIEGLGSYIWAASPEILRKVNAINIDQTTKEKLHNLYYKQKLMYSYLPDNYKTRYYQ